MSPRTGDAVEPGRRAGGDAEVPAPPGLRWSHVALNCADQRVTEEFYRRWFGFERARVVPLGDQEIIFLRQGSVYLELFSSPTPSPVSAQGDGPPYTGIARHLAFQTDDLASFLARLDGQVPISLGPLAFDDFIPGWRSVWLTDPDGVVVEVSQGYRDADGRLNGQSGVDPTHGH